MASHQIRKIDCNSHAITGIAAGALVVLRQTFVHERPLLVEHRIAVVNSITKDSELSLYGNPAPKGHTLFRAEGQVCRAVPGSRLPRRKQIGTAGACPFPQLIEGQMHDDTLLFVPHRILAF